MYTGSLSKLDNSVKFLIRRFALKLNLTEKDKPKLVVDNFYTTIEGIINCAEYGW